MYARRVAKRAGAKQQRAAPPVPSATWPVDDGVSTALLAVVPVASMGVAYLYALFAWSPAGVSPGMFSLGFTDLAPAALLFLVIAGPAAVVGRHFGPPVPGRQPSSSEARLNRVALIRYAGLIVLFAVIGSWPTGAGGGLLAQMPSTFVLGFVTGSLFTFVRRRWGRRNIALVLSALLLLAVSVGGSAWLAASRTRDAFESGRLSWTGVLPYGLGPTVMYVDVLPVGDAHPELGAVTCAVWFGDGRGGRILRVVRGGDELPAELWVIDPELVSVREAKPCSKDLRKRLWSNTGLPSAPEPGPITTTQPTGDASTTAGP